MASMTCYIGGSALSTYNATLMDGALDAIFKPAGMKNYVTNENAAMDGQKVLGSYHKVDKRTFQIPVAVKASTNAAYMTSMNSLLSALKSSAEVELKLIEDSTTYRFWVSFVDVQTYVHWNGRWGKMIIRLCENNPADREARE